MLTVLREIWHELVRKSIDLNREINRTWLILGMGVRYRNIHLEGEGGEKRLFLVHFCSI